MQYLLTQSEFEEYQRLKFQRNLTDADERHLRIQLEALWDAVWKIEDDQTRHAVIDNFEADLKAKRLASNQEGQPKREEPEVSRIELEPSHK